MCIYICKERYVSLGSSCGRRNRWDSDAPRSRPVDGKPSYLPSPEIGRFPRGRRFAEGFGPEIGQFPLRWEGLPSASASPSPFLCSSSSSSPSRRWASSPTLPAFGDE